MSHLRHPNVVQFVGVSLCPGDYFIVLEYCAKGNVHDLLRESRASDRLLLSFLMDAARGVNYLHSSEPVIVHRDLKCQNLLVDERMCVKVCDFGLSRVKNVDGGTMTAVGTPAYAAPEVLRHGRYDQKADVYSFGMIMWEVAHEGNAPFPGLNPIMVGLRVVNEGLRPTIQPTVHPLYAKLMTQCWDTDAAKRPSFEELLATLLSFDRRDVPVHTTDRRRSAMGMPSQQVNAQSNAIKLDDADEDYVFFQQ
eukprot:Rmarinus@m.73